MAKPEAGRQAWQAVASRSGASAQGAITDINVTPLVDVCLVLVIIFMVLAPMAMQAGIEVFGSRMGAAKGEAAVSKNVTLTLGAKGDLAINGQKVAPARLGDAMRLALARSKDKLVAVNASPKVTVGQVVEVLDVSKQSGAKRLALLNP